MNSRSPFTFRFWDLLTLTEIDKLPLDEVQCSKEVCADGSFAGRLNLADPNVQKRDWLKATVGGRTLIGVDYLDSLLWGGILWGRRYKKTTGVLQLAGAGPGSYYNKRKQAKDYTSTWSAGAPPMQIVKRVLKDAEALPSALKMTIRSSGELGSTAIVSLPISSPQNIKAIIERLAEMGPYGGFDYSFDVEYEPGTTKPMIVLTMRIPLLGALYKDSGLTVLGNDCVDFEWPEDATEEAWKITGIGAGGIIEEVEEPSVGVEGVPLLEDIVSKPSTTGSDVLKQEAAGELFARARPVETPSIILPLWDIGGSSAWVGFKDLHIGDELKFRVDPADGAASENVDPRFPHGIDEVRRATNWVANIQPAGVSTMTVALNITPLLVAHAEYQAPEFTEGESKAEQEAKEKANETTEEKGTSEEAAKEEAAKEEAEKAAKERLERFKEPPEKRLEKSGGITKKNLKEEAEKEGFKTSGGGGITDYRIELTIIKEKTLPAATMSRFFWENVEVGKHDASGTFSIAAIVDKEGNPVTGKLKLDPFVASVGYVGFAVGGGEGVQAWLMSNEGGMRLVIWPAEEEKTHEGRAIHINVIKLP
jgi:hypothetical protein